MLRTYRSPMLPAAIPTICVAVPESGSHKKTMFQEAGSLQGNRSRGKTALTLCQYLQRVIMFRLRWWYLPGSASSVKIWFWLGYSPRFLKHWSNQALSPVVPANGSALLLLAFEECSVWQLRECMNYRIFNALYGVAGMISSCAMQSHIAHSFAWNRTRRGSVSSDIGQRIYTSNRIFLIAIIYISYLPNTALPYPSTGIKP